MLLAMMSRTSAGVRPAIQQAVQAVLVDEVVSAAAESCFVDHKRHQSTPIWADGAVAARLTTYVVS